MKRMKRMISTFACAVAVLIWTCAPAQAEFFGTLRSDQDWVINVDNSSSYAASSISVNFLSKKPQNFGFTLPAGGRAQYPFAKVGRDVTRIIIYMDPPKGGTMTLEVAQNNSMVETCTGGYGCRLVMNVE